MTQNDGTTFPIGFSVEHWVPPDDFDPLQASDTELSRLGFLPRPTDKTLLKVWEDFWATKPTFVAPSFEVVPNIRTSRPHLMEKSTNWCGALAYPEKVLPGFIPLPILFITAQFYVPAVTVPTSPPAGETDFYCSVWVGIDGWTGVPSNDVLQAGSESMVSTADNGFRETYFWIEWFPEYRIRELQFPIAPGNLLQVSLAVGSNDATTIAVKNITNNVATQFTITPPEGITLKGNVAEWIVERPAVNGKLSQLANFGTVEFYAAYASSEFGLAPTQPSDTINMVTDFSGTGQTIATASLQVPIQCKYVGP